MNTCGVVLQLPSTLYSISSSNFPRGLGQNTTIQINQNTYLLHLRQFCPSCWDWPLFCWIMYFLGQLCFQWPSSSQLQQWLRVFWNHPKLLGCKRFHSCLSLERGVIPTPMYGGVGFPTLNWKNGQQMKMLTEVSLEMQASFLSFLIFFKLFFTLISMVLLLVM